MILIFLYLKAAKIWESQFDYAIALVLFDLDAIVAIEVARLKLFIKR